MPSVSKKQHNFMAAIANNPKFAKKVGIPRSVGEDFMEADKGKKFRKGGEMKNTSRMNRLEELGRVDAEKAYTPKGKMNLSAEKKRVVGELKYAKGGELKAMINKEVDFMNKKGAPKSMIKHEMAEAKGMKAGGYAKGGMSECKTVAKKEVKAHEKRMHKMAGGGKVAQLSKADGVATKGKSKGTMVKMKKGGYC